MPKHYIPAQGIEGPEFKIKVNRDGVWTLVEVVRDKVSKTAELLDRPMRTSHRVFGWLLLDDMEAETEPGDVVAVTYRYIGQKEEEDQEEPPLPITRLRISTSDEPILSHAIYDELPDDEKLVLAKIVSGSTEDGLDEQISSELGTSVLAKIRRGQTAYRDPKVEFTKSWKSNKPLSDLNNIGKIDTPSEAPEVADNRNWLSTGAEQEQVGNSYELSLVWELSGRGGWDEDLYT